MIIGREDRELTKAHQAGHGLLDFAQNRRSDLRACARRRKIDLQLCIFLQDSLNRVDGIFFSQLTASL